jgi:uncharacterized protein (DUF488 family)
MLTNRETIWTIGHSRHELEDLLNLIQKFQIEIIVDVRTVPMSKMTPQFNEGVLNKFLNSNNIKYIPMGKELGGRPDPDYMYDEKGRVLYNKLAESDLFKSGIDRILKGIKANKVALLCSEGKPDACHRHLLIGKVLDELGLNVINIYPDGTSKTYLELTKTDDQLTLLDIGGEKVWKSVLPVRQESQQNDSFYD